MHTIHETHHDYTKNLSLCLSKWLRRKARRLLLEHLNAALVLLRINLDSIAPPLKSLYSSSPRGRKPYDPLCMLRALLLMLLLQEASISKWASTLRHKPRLAIIAGFEPYKTPSVGAFYLFIDRLEDGPFQPINPNSSQRITPSQLRKKKFPRNLKKEKETRKVRNSKLQIDEKAQNDQVTQQLKDKLLKEEDQPIPNDFLHRLEQLLLKCALIPSAQRGLLGNGNLNALELFGDSSPLVSNASPYGKATCNCRQEGIYNCEHDRIYSDNTATWGWDSYREVFFFGHRFYQHQVSAHNHDLPVHITIAPAHESDMTQSLKSLDRFLKLLKLNEHQSDGSESSDSKGLKSHNWKVASATYDAGHDALGIYEYLLAKEINPVIALNPRSSGTSSNSSKQRPLPKATGNASLVNEEGIPLCPAGLLMRRHAHNKKKHRIYYNCPVKRPTNRNSKAQWISHIEECPLGKLCQPETKMGPVVYVKTTDNPRLYPTIPRDSLRFKELMNQRSGCERSNSIKKVACRLEERPCRSATHFLFRLYLIALIEHAKAWLAEDRKRLGENGNDSDDPLLLIQ